MKQFWLVIAVAIVLANVARADGVTDFVVNPATGYTISEAGSYRLAANVAMSDNVPAITITANNVAIDLGNHTLAGGPGNSVDGISGASATNVTVFDGTFTFFGLNSIALGDRANVRNCQASACARFGIIVGAASVVEGCRAFACGTQGDFGGISVGTQSTVRDCIASSNTPATFGSVAGILAGSNCKIIGNTANANSAKGDDAGTGIKAGLDCTITGNTANGNVGANSIPGVGIDAADRCIIAGNTANENLGGTGGDGIGIDADNYATISGNIANSNVGGGTHEGMGISAGVGCVIEGNTASRNGGGATGDGYGIRVGSFATIIGNTCSGNTEGAGGNGLSHGIFTSGNSLVERNVCSDNRYQGADGSGYGIYCFGLTTVRGNTVTINSGTGAGVSRGIHVESNCLVENNHCGTNTGGASSYGIFVAQDSTVVKANTTVGHITAGIRLSVAGSRSESNRCKEAVGVSAVGGNSLGAGDLADVAGY